MTTTTTAAMLPRPQWALLNLVIRREVTRRDLTATSLLTVCSASAADLVALAGERLVFAHVKGQAEEVDLTDLPAGRTARARRLASLAVRLTSHGRAWLADNPRQRVLLACDAQVRPRPVGRLARDWGLDAEGIVACCEQGLTGLTGEAGRAVAPDLRLVRNALDLKPVGLLLLGLVPAGRAVINPAND